MLTMLIMGLLYVLWFGLTVTLVWGIPAYLIYREKHVDEQRRRMWLLANVFFPWIAYFVFMMVAPVRSQSPF